MKIKESVATERLNKIRIRDQFWSVKTYFDLKKLIWADACGPLELNLNKKLRLQIRFYPIYNRNLIISLFQSGHTPLGVIKTQKSVDPEKKKFTCAYCGDKFPDKSTRIMHERATHVNSEMNLMEITCKICQEILPSSVHFRRHAIDKVDW